MDVDLSKHAKIVDTLVLSRLFNPVREGGHSLESWGYRLGHRKIEFEEFERYTPDMLTYCENDTRLNYKVFNTLKAESSGFSSRAVILEHEATKIMTKPLRGFLKNIYAKMHRKEKKFKRLLTFEEFVAANKDNILGNAAFAKLNLKAEPRFFQFKLIMKQRFEEGIKNGKNVFELLDKTSEHYILKDIQNYIPTKETQINEVKDSMTFNEEENTDNSMPQIGPNETWDEFTKSDRYLKWKASQ